LRRRVENMRMDDLRFGRFCSVTGEPRLFCLRSDKLVCMRRIATPPSSIEKSNPRCTDRIPVDISVRLAQRGSCVLRISSDRMLDDCDAREEGREMREEARRFEGVDGLYCICSLRRVARSILGSVFRMYRNISRSPGAYPSCHAR